MGCGIVGYHSVHLLANLLVCVFAILDMCPNHDFNIRFAPGPIRIVDSVHQRAMASSDDGFGRNARCFHPTRRRVERSAHLVMHTSQPR